MPVRTIIADDEFLITLTLRHQLEEQGCEVVGTASNGVEAIRLCHASHPDMIFMDVRMPEMDGITATRRVMEECPHPVVIITGSTEFRDAAERAGAMGYTLKPLLSQQIPKLVAAAQERFAQYLEVHQEEGSCALALQAWPFVQEAVRKLAAAHRLTELEAFAQLRQTATAHHRRLGEEATTFLHKGE